MKLPPNTLQAPSITWGWEGNREGQFSHGYIPCPLDYGWVKFRTTTVWIRKLNLRFPIQKEALQTKLFEAPVLSSTVKWWQATEGSSTSKALNGPDFEERKPELSWSDSAVPMWDLHTCSLQQLSLRMPTFLSWDSYLLQIKPQANRHF